ncbi:hypothetical protein CEXT_72781 [Caerostris extrusa]|uniref:Uncharacterized protein n=1 Tax=Caerostris extrusa TaxID=172846 RepID=A0AAV4TRZ2_CAEEX|nr:hypothetical protein CEXT_72781 [Caerostris extrusa]
MVTQYPPRKLNLPVPPSKSNTRPSFPPRSGNGGVAEQIKSLHRNGTIEKKLLERQTRTRGWKRILSPPLLPIEVLMRFEVRGV